MRPLTRTLVLIASLVFLVVPLSLTVAGIRPGAPDNRAPSSRPALGPRELVDQKTYQQLDSYLSDRFAFRGLAIRSNAKLNELVWKGDRGDVRRGEDGWLYYGPSLDRLCTEKLTVADASVALDRLADAFAAKDVTFRYVLAPEKSTIYPEHLSDRLRRDAECGGAAREELLVRLRPKEWFVDLFEPLAAAKPTAVEPLYYPRDTHWTERGAQIMLDELLATVEPGLRSPGDAVLVGPMTFTPDLTNLLGLPQQVQAEDFVTRREGVTTTAGPEQPVEGTFPVLRYTSTSTGARLIEGRTVFIYDSFSQAVLDQLAPYFADVVFVHWNALGAYDVTADFGAATTVVMEGAEREFTWRMQEKVIDTALADAVGGS